MSKPFHTALRRVNRANRKIEQFERESSYFATNQAMFMGIEPHTLDGRVGVAYKIKQIEGAPDELSDYVDTTIDGLRAALDSACYDSGEALGKPTPKYANFPFADSARELENTIKGRCKDIHPEIVDLLRSFAPYEAGNKVLWAFNKARQVNQHKSLVDFVISIGNVTLDKIKVVNSGRGFALVCKWYPVEREFIVAHWMEGAEIEIGTINAEVYPAFINAGALDGQPVIGGLKEIASIVEGIVIAIKGQTERLLRG